MAGNIPGREFTGNVPECSLHPPAILPATSRHIIFNAVTA